MRMINVNRSPNDDASGVAILSRIRFVVKTVGAWINAKSARYQNERRHEGTENDARQASTKHGTYYHESTLEPCFSVWTSDVSQHER